LLFKKKKESVADVGYGIRDPVLFDPWIRGPDPKPGMEKNSEPGSGIRDEHLNLDLIINFLG
jgi:hypothetical protein